MFSFPRIRRASYIRAPLLLETRPTSTSAIWLLLLRTPALDFNNYAAAARRCGDGSLLCGRQRLVDAAVRRASSGRVAGGDGEAASKKAGTRRDRKGRRRQDLDELKATDELHGAAPADGYPEPNLDA